MNHERIIDDELFKDFGLELDATEEEVEETESEEEIEVEETIEDISEDESEEAEENLEESSEADDQSEEDTESTPKAVQAERAKYKKRVEAERLEKEKALAELKEEREKALKYKMFADQMSSTTGKDFDSLFDQVKEIEIEKLVAQGTPEEVAKEFVELKLSKTSLQNSMKAQSEDVEKAKSDKEIATLIESNRLLSGIKDHRDEVVKFSKEKGLTIEQAYRALYSQEIDKAYRVAVKDEAKFKQKPSSAPKVSIGSGNGPIKTQTKSLLTKEQRQVYAEAGYNLSEMENIVKARDIDEYRKLKKK